MMLSLRISLLQALTLTAGNFGGSHFATSFKPIPIPVSVANLLGRGLITEQEVWAAVDAFIGTRTSDRTAFRVVTPSTWPLLSRAIER